MNEQTLHAAGLLEGNDNFTCSAQVWDAVEVGDFPLMKLSSSFSPSSRLVRLLGPECDSGGDAETGSLPATRDANLLPLPP